MNRNADVKKVLNRMVERGVALNMVSYTTLIDIHYKEGDMVEARRIFREMGSKGVSPGTTMYNVMIDGYSKKGIIREAERVRKDMEKKGMMPDVLSCPASQNIWK